MKKLLLTSALAGATLVASNAIAQTTVSGNLDITFKAISGESASTGTGSAASHRGFGKEAQLNIQNKGKLSNGMDYAAGFAIEDDGNQGTTIFNENTFINFTSGSTTLTLSQDHIQNSDRTLATFVGLPPQDISNTNNSAQVTTDGFIGGPGADPAQAFGVGIIQATPMGNFSALYVSSNAGAAASAYGAENGTSDNTDESAYELGFVGGLGVKGLSAHAFMNKENKANADTRDNKGQNFGVSYNFGQITAGYNYKKSEFGTRGGVAVNSNDTKQHEYGLAFAVSPTLTIGANYAKAENSGTGAKADADSKSLAVGYNLGAVVLTAQVAQQENIDFATGSTAKDIDVLYLRASTKF
jgi:hypothetical protein